MSHHRPGLAKLTPELLAKARDDTNAQITRILLTFLSTAVFCVLSLLTPDTALLGGNEKINVPLVGSVSFFGFMVLGPAILIALRVYLQIYIEHDHRLNRLAQHLPPKRAPTLISLENDLIRILSSFTLYLLLPLLVMMFAWKAAVFPVWGIGLFSVAVAVAVMQLMLPLRSFSWLSKTILGMGGAILTSIVLAAVGTDTVHRPFDLFRANLPDQSLAKLNLKGANLAFSNLTGTDLNGADMRDADLTGAKLTGTSLSDTDLGGASLRSANLSGALLGGANLAGADLSDANLSGAILDSAYLARSNLYGANLKNADLYNAKLNGATLSNADLGGANLSNADLSDAILTLAKNLAQDQLDKACGTKPESLGPSLRYFDKVCAFAVRL